MHACQLIVQSSLRLVDQWLQRSGIAWKLFASLAKLSLVWRDNASDVYKIWLLLWGGLSGNSAAKTKFPRCIAGRWGSIASVTGRLRRTGQEQTTAVIRWLLGDRSGITPQGLQSSVADPLPLDDRYGPADRNNVDSSVVAVDELGLEAQEAYRRKMGRWRADVLRCVKSNCFWIVMQMFDVTQGPLQHHFNMVQKRSGMCGEEVACTGGVLAGL
eukprot:7826042-Alexandrium_andersonii.AAC.1